LTEGGQGVAERSSDKQQIILTVFLGHLIYAETMNVRSHSSIRTTFSMSPFFTSSSVRRFIGLQRGFTLVEMLVVLVIIGVMGTVAVGLYNNQEDDGREKTLAIMDTIKMAILGDDAAPLVLGVAVSGYVQDMGELPPLNKDRQPEALWHRGGRPLRRYNKEARIWVGWNGPYLEPPESGHLTDGWGNGLFFQRRERTLVITSAGADQKLGGAGTGEDLTLAIREEDYMAPVGGRMSPRASNVVLYYPESGSLQKKTIPSAGKGQFLSRTNEVPIGLRSIVVTIEDEERCFVFAVRPTINWLGKLQ
jgi:prepilin-type N-terminal cleavage/methylation domain-containing protein